MECAGWGLVHRVPGSRGQKSCAAAAAAAAISPLATSSDGLFCAWYICPLRQVKRPPRQAIRSSLYTYNPPVHSGCTNQCKKSVRYQGSFLVLRTMISYEYMFKSYDKQLIYCLHIGESVKPKAHTDHTDHTSTTNLCKFICFRFFSYIRTYS